MAKYRFDQVARECRTTFKGDKNGMPIVGLEHLVPNEMLVRDFEVDTENTFTKSFKQGQILFGRRRAYQQKAGVAQFDGICSGDITVIEAIPGKIEPNLLPFIVQNEQFFEHAVQGSAGSLSPRVKWEHLASYEIELPTMEKQRVLADKLWTAYRLKESYKKLLAATDEMVKSRFIEMCSNTNNAQSLETVCTTMNKGIVPKYVDSSCSVVINQSCVQWDDQHLENVKYHDDEVLLNKRELETGDVLLNATGRGTLGRCCIFKRPIDNKHYINDGHVIALTTDRTTLLPEVLNAFLALNDVQADIYRQYVTGSTNQLDIVFTEIKKMMIPVPNMEEQKRFFAIYKQSDKSKLVGHCSMNAMNVEISKLINKKISII